MMKPKSRLRSFARGFLFLLALVIVFLAGRLIGLRSNVDDGATDPVSPVVKYDNIESPKDEGKTPYGDDALGGTKLEVDWVAASAAEPVDAKFLATVKDRLYTGNGTTEKNGSVMYKLGTVKGKAYAGETLSLVVLETAGLGRAYEYYYLLTDYGSSGAVTLINRTAGFGGLYNEKSYTAEDLLGDVASEFVDVKNATPVQMGTVVTIDKDVYVPEFNQIPGGVARATDPIEDVKGTGQHELVVLGVGERLSEFPSDASIISRLADDTFLREREDKGKNLFFTVREDMRAVWYDVVIPFWKPVAGESGAIPSVTWINGSANTETYVKGEMGGCGFSVLTHVVDVAELGELAEAGTTAQGEKIYTQKDTSSARLSEAFSAWAFQHQDKTFTDFLNVHPFFYYKDSFERWIEFTNTQVLPAAECGKPVIYLYPTTPQDLTVQLAPQGGFTKTEPAYGNGWHVKATPTGSLTNLADGNVYPYLFWEGRGGLYQEPTNYWVVSKQDVHVFLSSTLARLGLNQKEIEDFEAFWEPRMTSANYYKIGFHGTNVMNQIALMTISQKPQTLIRVLMDYTPINTVVDASPPVLPKTPVRNGFTVVEWGGVIR